MKDLSKIGLPIWFTHFSEIIGGSTGSLFSGWLGLVAIAARNFGASLEFLSIIPLFSFGQSACQEVSRSIGGKNYRRANQFARGGLASIAMIMTCLCVIFSLSPELLTRVIATDVNETVLSLAKKLMPIVAIGMFFDATRYNKLQVLRAANDHYVPSAISVSTQWLGVLLSYLLGFKAELGMLGLVIGDATAKAAGSLALLHRWYNKLQPESLAAQGNLDSHLRETSNENQSLLRSRQTECGSCLWAKMKRITQSIDRHQSDSALSM